MNPFAGSTVLKWMKISDSEFDTLYSISKRTGKCLRFDCPNHRSNLEDMLCPKHRKEYNKWSEQFFLNRPIQDNPKEEGKE